MKNKNIQYLLLLTLIFTSSFSACIKNTSEQQSTEKHDTTITKSSSSEIIEIVKKVNNHWQQTHTEHGNVLWNGAVYHIGNLAAYKITGIEDYRLYTETWAGKNETETKENGLNKNMPYDWQACFQAYLMLYQLDSLDAKIEEMKETISNQIHASNDNYWNSTSNLYITMPVMTKMYILTQNKEYLDRLHSGFDYAKNLLYDSESGLFYSDRKSKFPQHKTLNGLKDFESVSNAWAFAAIVRTLEDLPINDPKREGYIRIYETMATTLAKEQQKEGYWTCSILDPKDNPGPETSGTAFFTYGLLWGINNNLLDEEIFLPTINKAWKYLTETALQPDGKIGYVQQSDDKQTIDADSTADVGVGAFLLAAAEMTKCLQ
ncbi:glycoside hydrolase family 88 protein [Dysgonomonas sp. 216]|uniref:glycoside hydrolase family 88 protein n=1 Tax=Dysgonomonas sp. 216 TaxID=2302934 RepID=UPI0013D8A2CC|nr:glycoside hydrolase family 88 protein [Dysgonomonas sp. 216]NDW19147.1 glycoside hydrolase family 88 protein [Dysgonomonas sp. 216]